MDVPEGLGERGAALWKSLGQQAGTPSGDLALEACRTADRLDDLDAIVRGKGVVNLLTFRLDHEFHDEGGDKHVHVKVEFSGVLAEARQQQMALKQTLAALGVGAATKPEPERKGSPLDELANRRAGRGAAAKDSGRASRSGK